MDRSVEGKRAIVTGAGAGNGRAIALALAAAGAAVVCADRREDTARETARMIGEAGGAARAVAADIAAATDCRRAVELAAAEFGGLDILVNNAGVLRRGGILETTEEDWDFVNGVNVKGTFLMTQAAVPQLRQRAGVIVMISSLAGLRGSATHLAYTASKHAVIGLTRSLALELAADGIRVNAVCPGLIDTEMIRDNGAPLSERVKGYPLGRIGRPQDVARVVLHLASEAGFWTTGICYPLDGGAGLGARA